MDSNRLSLYVSAAGDFFRVGSITIAELRNIRDTQATTGTFQVDAREMRRLVTALQAQSRALALGIPLEAE
jgi:hypothetical protein